MDRCKGGGHGNEVAIRVSFTLKLARYNNTLGLIPNARLCVRTCELMLMIPFARQQGLICFVHLHVMTSPARRHRNACCLGGKITLVPVVVSKK